MDRATPLYIEILAGQRLWFRPNFATSFTIDLIEYSYDVVSWIPFTVDNRGRYYIDVNVGDKVYVRAKSSSGYYWEKSTYFWNFQIERNGQCNLGGNIMSLIYGDQFNGDEVSFPMNTKNNFRGIFQYLNVIDASQLLLPSTNLTDGCYRELFGSTALNTSAKTLVKAPTITQATLPTGGYPYDYMFAKCDNLESLTIENTNIRTSDWILDNMSPKTIVYKKENVGSLRNPNNLTIVTLKNTPFNIANAKEWVVNNKRVKRVVDSLGRIIWQMIPPQPQPDEYFYIKNTGSNRAVVLFPTHNTNFYDQKTIYYSFDKTTWNSTNTERSSNPMSITTFFFLPAGEKVYLKASVPNGFKGTYIYVADENWNTQNVNFEVGGNLMSLIYSDNYKTMDTIPYSATGALEYLFYNAVGLKDASRLALPSTINEKCYEFMFAGCTSLTRPPVLPSTSMAPECYYAMFDGCTSLMYAPALPAITLAQSCYSSMFAGCTSLVVAPELPATTLALQCYYSMFDGCSSLNEIKCNAVTTASINDTLFWTRGVAASGTFYKNSNASFWTAGMDGIPSGWTVVDL